MSSDPRRGIFIALVVLACCLVWFAASVVFAAPIRDALGMNRHAITFGAMVIAIAATATALVFARFAAVRDELLAGRRVLGRWSVDPSTWTDVAPTALAVDAANRRSALAIVLLFVVLTFGGIALADPEAAPGMMLFGLIVVIAAAAAAVIGRQAQQSHWRLRSGEVIVGDRGLLSNGVLHVWALPLSRLVDARLTTHPPALVVVYSWISRAGWQEVAVVAPVPPTAEDTAQEVRDALSALAGRTGRRQRRTRM